ncbi:MAG: SDR family NAD(P)-dependent oxidoreductase [Bacilli bacterium]
MKSKNSQVIVITGASSGIGQAAADYLATLGHRVYGLSRSNGSTAPVTYIPCDVTKRSSIVEAIQQIITLEGTIDVFINNAGMGVSGAVEYSTEQDLSASIDVNLTGLIQATQIVLPYVRLSKGLIINMSSVAGILAIPFQAYYSLTKAAVIQFSKALALETKPFGVRIACILPGDTKTSFTKNRHQPAILIDVVYHHRIQRSLERMEKDEIKGDSPIKVAKVIHRVICKKNPAIVNIVGFNYQFLVLLSRILPTRLVQWILYQMYAK